MQPFPLIMLILASMITIASVFQKSTKKQLIYLIFQSIMIGSAEIGRYVDEFTIISGHSNLLIHAPSIIMEFIFCFAISPIIMFIGIKKTENGVDQITSREYVIHSVVIGSIITINGVILYRFASELMVMIVFCSLIICVSIFYILTRKDGMKILIGTCLTENALFPLLIDTSLFLTIILGLSTILINLIGVLVVLSGYTKYKSLNIDLWREISLETAS